MQLQLPVVTGGSFDRERAVHCIERCRERGERLVSPCFDRLSVIQLDQWPHQCPMLPPSSEPLPLTLCHQRRVADDVGEHDGGEPALGAELLCHAESSPGAKPTSSRVLGGPAALRQVFWPTSTARTGRGASSLETHLLMTMNRQSERCSASAGVAYLDVRIRPSGPVPMRLEGRFVPGPGDARRTQHAAAVASFVASRRTSQDTLCHALPR